MLWKPFNRANKVGGQSFSADQHTLSLARQFGADFRPADLEPISCRLIDSIHRLVRDGLLEEVRESCGQWRYRLTPMGLGCAASVEIPDPAPVRGAATRGLHGGPPTVRLADLAPGDTCELWHMPGVRWEVVAAWQRSDASYQPVGYVELYNADRGSRLVRAADLTEELLTVPRPLKRLVRLRPVR